MIPFIVFVCPALIVLLYMVYTWAHDIGEAFEEELTAQWNWLLRANARRKRVERALRRERAMSAFLQKNNLNRLADINYLLEENKKLTEENKKLTNHYRSLAADVVEGLVMEQDRESVTKNLTRKL